jgi:hypothetical protein
VSPSGGERQDQGSSRQPLLNARFRIEIEGLPGTGATEVIFPEARIVGLRGKARTVQYGSLTIRRGMTSSSDWYQWWDRARRSPAAAHKDVSVVVMDSLRADAARWTFAKAVPSAYSVSPLNALGSEPLIETLELSVRGLTMAFGPGSERPSDSRS